MFKFFAACALVLPALASAASMPTGAWPASTGTPVKYSAPYVVKAGTTFDGKMKTYERSNVKCSGQKETGKDSAVFLVEPGATLKNVIIGVNQAEGVHCENHDCTIENVWWPAVCEDALTIKGGKAASVAKVIGGGARGASDKVIQHNGYGTVSIDGFYAENFGKLYRGCGNCGTKIQRKVIVSNVYAVNPKKALVMVNQNYGDVAKLTNIKIKTSKSTFPAAACIRSNAVPKGSEPTEAGEGPDGKTCVYDKSQVTVVKGRLRE